MIFLKKKGKLKEKNFIQKLNYLNLNINFKETSPLNLTGSCFFIEKMYHVTGSNFLHDLQHVIISPFLSYFLYLTFHMMYTFFVKRQDSIIDLPINLRT